MRIIAGNWKMNGTRAELETMLGALKSVRTENRVVLCVPFTLLGAKSDNILIGAQDVSPHEIGAYTGEVSAKMLADAGVKYVIVGHSERRQNHSESNEIVRQKAAAALAFGITPIICVGESLEQKRLGKTFEVIREQILNSVPLGQEQEFGTGNLIPLHRRGDISAVVRQTDDGEGLIKNLGKPPRPSTFAKASGDRAGRAVPQEGNQPNPQSPIPIIAYEPLWAIGTGLTPTLKEIRETHAYIRGLTSVSLLYGGSVKPNNANEIMSIPNVDGVLVGGASLKPSDFIPIIESV